MANLLDYIPLEVILAIAYLLDPLDIIRLTAVSMIWYHYAVKNEIAKMVCLKRAPMLSNISNVVHVDDIQRVTTPHRNEEVRVHFRDLQRELKDHKIYSNLLLALSKASINPKDCIEFVIGASSTNNYPKESIVNVLLPSDAYIWGRSYWLSIGHTDDDVPESIIFKVKGGVCIVTEIQIRPYLAQFEYGECIFSARSIRFSMGHSKPANYLMLNANNLPLEKLNHDDFIWGYTSPEFPMEQVYDLQTFVLPEPVLCIGGFLKIELLGMAQKEFTTNLYYYCIGHVEIHGHSLSPAYDIQMDEERAMTLMYNASEVDEVLRQIPVFVVEHNMMIEEHLHGMIQNNESTQAAQIRNMIQEKLNAGDDDDDDDGDDNDEDDDGRWG